MSTLIAPAVTSPSLADCRRAVQDQLAIVRRRLRLQLLMEGIAWGIGTAVLLTAASLFLDRLLRLDLAIRVALLAIGAVALASVAIRRLRAPIFLTLDDLDLAELLERRQKGIGQRLATVLQLPRLLEQDPSASPSMIQAAVREDFDALQKIDLQAAFKEERRRNVLFLIVSLIAIVTVFCFTNPVMASLWARRWFGGANIRWPQRSYLVLSSLGDANKLQVPSGEAVTIQVESANQFTSDNGAWRLSGRGEPLIIESVTQPVSLPPENVSLKLLMADGTQRIGNFSKYAVGQYRYELPPISKPATITITGGDDWFGPVTIEPIPRPTIDSLTILAHTPGKSEPDKIRADDAEQQLLFLPTTRLEFELISTQPLSSAKVSLSGSDKPGPELVKQDGQTYRMTWEMSEPVTFEFQLVSELGGLASKPYFLTLGLLNDRSPRLTLRSTGVGRRVTPVAQIPLNLRVMDDFGIAKLALELEEVRIVEQKPTTANHKPLEENFVESGQKLPTDLERETPLSLIQYNLIPGNSIRVRGTASDASVLGAQSAESRWLAFQIVSKEELFYEILSRQREQRAKLAKALDSSKGQIDSLRRMSTSAEAGAIVRAHQAIARQVWQIAGQLNGTLQEMTLNDLGAPASRQLLEVSIIKPLYELHATPMTELRGKLEALTASQTIDEEPREAANAAQTTVNEQIQRILDKMSEWESFVDAVNQLRSIISSETQIHDTTEKTQKEQVKEVFDEE